MDATNRNNEEPSRKPWVNWVLFLGTVIIVFILGIFAASIVERRTEAQLYFQMVHPIAEFEPRNYVWGENFPRQYQSYVRTMDTTFESRYAGSTHVQYLDRHPEMVIMWAGFAFSFDYEQARGHYYSVTDIHRTLRTTIPQPATCWTCKSTDVPRMMNQMGVGEFYNSTWEELGSEVVNHIGCQDCHDPQTMNLRITRPALAEAWERRGKDILQSTHQEMRSLVCAQCHVEYYFRTGDRYLMFPFDHGFSAEAMEYYFDSLDFADWTHALSRAPMIKAQHPDYELYRTGIHAARGVSCADCHMPYIREGGIKFTNHHLRSPLADIAGSCQVCHRESEEDLRNVVYDRQDKIFELRRRAERNLATLHLEAAVAWDVGATEADMAEILRLIRRSQWRWDWVAAANGYGFHSPAESLRVLGTSIDMSQEARVLLSHVLARYGVNQPVELPQFTTMAEAQEVLGLDMAEIRRRNQVFLEEIAPVWLEEAEAREEAYPHIQR
jgi:nitrite reductase (cytochrome c-552)